MAEDGASIEGGMLAELRALQSAARDYRLSRGDVGVYSVLLAHMRDGVARPGPARISEHARLAVSNVKASLTRLESLRYIEILRTKARVQNRYRLLNPPCVPSLKGELARAEAMMSLGALTGLDAKPSRARASATQRELLGIRTDLAKASSMAAPGDTDRTAPGDADRTALGMRTGTELALNSSYELKEQRARNSEMPKAAAECFALALGKTGSG